MFQQGQTPATSQATEERSRVIYPPNYNLVHGARTPVERAFVGANLHLGRVSLVKPTIKQSAALARVSVPYVAAAAALADDQAAREAVLAGKVPLLEAAKTITPTETLVEHFSRASPAERLACARTLGPAWIWDKLVVPLI